MLIRSVTAVLLGLFAPLSAQAQDGFPDLVGKWVCNIEYGAYFFDLLEGPYEFELEITEQLGAGFKGHSVWIGDRDELPDDQIDRPGQTIVAEEGTKVTIHEEFLGMIGWGDRNLHMVDIADDGIRIGRLLADGEFEMLAARAGEHAALTRTRCMKQPG